MASSINYSGNPLRQSLCFRANRGATLHFMPSKVSCQLKQNKMEIQQHGIHMRRQTKNKPSIKRGRYSIASSTDNRYSELNIFSASDTIKQFYACINDKNLKHLDAYVSDDCCFEDCSYPKPFHGKKEVIQFFQQLMSSMGQNMKFSIEHVCEGDEFTAGVNWHLEWKNTQVPFTKGCSFYECSIEGKRLVIKKARVVIESPVKPGGIVMTLLKNLTSLSDDFPKATEWILNSPHVILQFLLKIYTIFVAPLINPLLAGYITVWNSMARLLGLALNIMIYILKMFSK